jgi:hypothetical protein
LNFFDRRQEGIWMNWRRDVFKALAWAIGATILFVALCLSGLIVGLPLTLPLVAAPLLAGWWHHSRGVAGLVVLSLLVLGVAGFLLLVWQFRDINFRTIQG